MSGAVNIIIAISPNSPADKWCAEFFVDFPDFLYAIDIRLINAFNPAATAVIASGAEFAVYSACAPESLMNNAEAIIIHLLSPCDYNYVHYITTCCWHTISPSTMLRKAMIHADKSLRCAAVRDCPGIRFIELLHAV